MRASLFALLLFTSTPAIAGDKPVPKYEGKPLDYWVQRFQKAETAEVRSAAAEVIKKFGPEAAPAVPALIEMLSDLSREFRHEVIDILGAIGPAAKDARPAVLKLFREKKADLRERHVSAFVALHPKAEEAVPSLIPFLNDPDSCWDAFWGLCHMGPAAKSAIPDIRTFVLAELAAKEKDKERQLSFDNAPAYLGPDVVPLLIEMLDAHGGCGRDDALKGLETLGPKAKKAVPALLKVLKNDAAETRFRTAETLWQVDRNPAAVCALAALLNTPAQMGERPDSGRIEIQSDVARGAVRALGNIGPDARAALPQLREAAAVGQTLWLVTCDCDPPSSRYLSSFFIPRNRQPVYRPEAAMQWAQAERRIELGRAAQEAVDKIEQKPNK
jgi:HEAT repeat protein